MPKRVVRKPKRKLKRKVRGRGKSEFWDWDPVQKKSVPLSRPFPIYENGKWTLSNPMTGSGKVVRF